MIKYLIGGLVVLTLIMLGGVLAIYVISGLIMLAGIIFLVESIGWLKWIFVRIAHLVDLILFALSIYALFASGVTIALGLAVCSILYTVFYKPLLLKSRRA